MARVRIDPVDTAPLTPDEKQVLMDLYATRQQQMKIIYPVILVTLLMFFFTLPGMVVGEAIAISLSGNEVAGSNNPDINSVGGVAARIILALALAAFFSWQHYRYAVVPVKTDVEEGKKYKMPFRVTDKKYYPVTGQYMVHVFPIRHMVEVDSDTYGSCSEGDNIYLWQTIRTRFVFSQFEYFVEND